MDFFQYANIVDSFATFESRWLTYLVGGLCYAVVYVFLVFALYIIAKREGYKNRWMIFIPILNTYYIGVCARKNKLFGSIDARIVAAICAVFELLLVVGNILYYVSFETLISSGYLIEELQTVDYYGTYYIIYEFQLTGNVPANLEWASWIYYNISDYILIWLELVYIVTEFATFVLFFKTYSARRYMIFSITGVLFPIQGILAYTVKGNTGYNYEQFVLKERQKQYQAYQQQMRNNPNNNPYNNQYTGNPYSRNPYDNPYNNQYTNPGSGPDDDPFGGAGQASPRQQQDDDDPFAEYAPKNNNGGGGNDDSDDPFAS